MLGCLYRYRSRSSHKADWSTLRLVLDDVTSLTIHQLEPDTIYDFMVLSRNRLGDGMFSEVVQGRTRGLSLGGNRQI